ncbi:MAG: porin family protein [Saprospiraceae bacterium]
MFSVAPEIYFAIKGGTLQGKQPAYDWQINLQVYSLELPILARLHCKNLFLNAGPYAGYNLGGRLKIKDVETGQTTNTKINFGKAKSDLKNWDYGFQAGAGYNFNMKKSILTLDLRYGYGMAKYFLM